MNKIYVGKHKWFDADCLKYYGNTNDIDWINSVGRTVEFECHGVHGFYTIIGIDKNEELKNNCNRQYLYEIYFNDEKDKTHIVTRKALRDLKFSYLLDIYSADFLYNIGDVVNGKFEILEQMRKKFYKNDKAKNRVYKCKCLIDDYVFEMAEHELKDKINCPLCASVVVVEGVNDIQTLKPEVVRFLVNKEDALKYSSTTSKLLDFKCDICGHEFQSSLVYFPLTLPCGCYSAQSYPNRFIIELFNQLNIPYISELRKKHFEWCENYRYDLFFEYEGKRYIIEMDGGFHKNEKEKYTDMIKDNIANQNGIEVIRIDCDYKNAKERFSYIKNNTINSMLSEVIDLSNVDWDNINMKILTTNNAKEVWRLKEIGFTSKKISNILNISVSEVDRHTRHGYELGKLEPFSINNTNLFSKVMVVTNLETMNKKYYIGLKDFYENSLDYIGVKITNHYFKRVENNGHAIINGYDLVKITYEDYIETTITV